ncbi:DNA-3-methyladenine glycosylase family protein [Nonomuraea cavernae]|uniref:3-methyladenine DNA glycosylase n=1 Tax=Nonomuraea cavernae TaxID=2045107 RepID=A0A917ZHE5_9ACTN|nr:hypothetical protein [Nonomuraea cavernae]MCA2190849.1 hypothetical protein [Nonomuraea cavernae]GGO82838.1 hypothetical protein GCM10012289_74990 [Nonomuraea cavernae]
MNWMLDHPGWDLRRPPTRAMRTPTGTWLITATTNGPILLDGDGAAPHPETYDPAALADLGLPRGLARALHELGPVRRVRNTDLWDALATAIIRQVIRASQARTMYRELLAAAGQPAGHTYLPPTAEQILAMPDQQLADLGMAFKRRPLRAAAHAYLHHGDEWATMPADVLVKALQVVPRIGPWTAGAAVADHTGDFSVYPYGDLAVRIWASRADPATAWPDDEPGFAAFWRDLAGPHLSALTAVTLAWGDQHVHQSAHPGRPVQ